LPSIREEQSKRHADVKKHSIAPRALGAQDSQPGFTLALREYWFQNELPTHGRILGIDCNRPGQRDRDLPRPLPQFDDGSAGVIRVSERPDLLKAQVVAFRYISRVDAVNSLLLRVLCNHELERGVHIATWRMLSVYPHIIDGRFMFRTKCRGG
jgi:hypothetical protein